MAITEKQRADRVNYLGGSDLPAIMGVDPFGSAWDVWAKKRQIVAEETSEPEQFRDGNLLEPAILAFAEGELGKIRRNTTRRVPNLPIKVHLDAETLDTAVVEPCEAKMVQWNNPTFGEFGMAGSDEVAANVIVQTHGQMMAMRPQHEAMRAHNPCLLGGRFVMFCIPWSEKLAATIAERSVLFWQRHVVEGAEPDPDDYPPSLDVVMRVNRDATKTVEIESGLVKRWQQARDARLFMEKQEDMLKARVLAAMGDASIGIAGMLGEVTVGTSHMKESVRKAYDRINVKFKARKGTK